MSLIDERGRLRGRINVIDALALAIVAIAIGSAFAASRSMRGTALQIESVTNETSDTLDMHLVDREQAWIGRRVKGRAVDVSLRVPVLKMAPRSYQYTSAN